MKVTNDELISAKRALDKMLNEKLPIKTALELANLIGKVNDNVQAFTLVRDSLFKKYDIKAELLGNGETKITSPVEGNVKKFSEDFDELLLQEVEFVFKPVELPGTIEIDVNTLTALKKFIRI